MRVGGRLNSFIKEYPPSDRIDAGGTLVELYEKGLSQLILKCTLIVTHITNPMPAHEKITYIDDYKRAMQFSCPL